MVVGTGGDLGQVGHGQHLPVASPLLHQPTHGFGHCTAHAGDDFVENHRLGRPEPAGGDGNGQGNT